MKAVPGYSEETARRMYDYLVEVFTQDGMIKEKALKNVVDFSLAYGIVEKGKTPTLGELYT